MSIIWVGLISAPETIINKMIIAMPNRPPVFKPLGKPSKPMESVRKAEYDKTRAGSSARGYGFKWQKARKRFLEENPLCVICQAKQLVKAARIVDHIIPHKGNADLFWDKRNWQALCASCHSRKTATQDSSFAFKGGGDQSLHPLPPKTARVVGNFGAQNAGEKGKIKPL